MTSPVVWQDAFSRAQTVATSLGMDVLDALSQDRSDRDSSYLLFEVASASSTRMGAGEKVNEETGQIWLHLMVPSGTGALQAITERKTLGNAFRTSDPPWPAGLYYDDQAFDPPDSDQTGNWFRFSLMVDYRYQDMVLLTS